MAPWASKLAKAYFEWVWIFTDFSFARSSSLMRNITSAFCTEVPVSRGWALVTELNVTTAYPDLVIHLDMMLLPSLQYSTSRSFRGWSFRSFQLEKTSFTVSTQHWYPGPQNRGFPCSVYSIGSSVARFRVFTDSKVMYGFSHRSHWSQHSRVRWPIVSSLFHHGDNSVGHPNYQLLSKSELVSIFS